MTIRYLITAGLVFLLGGKVAAQACTRDCNGQSKCCKTMEPRSKITTKTEDFTEVEACHLTSGEQVKRYKELKGNLFKRIAEVKELGDGYELIFKENIEFANELIAFVNFERLCCPTFAFELRFEPQGGPIHLTIQGSKGIKDMVAFGLQEYGL